jgi:chemotaxis protein methyltransferase CheR
MELNEGLEVLKKIIEKKIEFYPDRYKERPFRRRIAVRMRHRKVKSFFDYAELLEKDEEEQRLLHKTLTINVSKFFRNYETFGKIREMVLPRIVEEFKRTGNSPSIWCAGCATGEESYTIAMLTEDFLSEQKLSIPYTVIGTDIDGDSLKSAEMGCYRDDVLDEIPERYLHEYFTVGDRYCVSERIKRRVKFLKLDIEEDSHELHNLDLVLFRNVLIYMEKNYQEKVLTMIHNRLGDRGFLVLGKVEILIGEAKNFFSIVDSRERIYRKCIVIKR